MTVNYARYLHTGQGFAHVEYHITRPQLRGHPWWLILGEPTMVEESHVIMGKLVPDFTWKPSDCLIVKSASQPLDRGREQGAPPWTRTKLDLMDHEWVSSALHALNNDDSAHARLIAFIHNTMTKES